MRKLIAIACIALVSSFSVALAGDGGPKGPKGSKLERMTRELKLTADQQARVKAILEAEHAKKAALKAETDGQFKAVLTKEQYSKLEHE